MNADYLQHTNRKRICDGLKFLGEIPDGFISLAFFDPQYRALLDKQKYGNEGAREKQRFELQAMSVNTIQDFILEIERVLIPSGHLCLWVDKFILVEGVSSLITAPNLYIVDMITWDKGRIGMGYRSRRKSEHLVILQKKPKRAKGVWKTHNIPDVWSEKVDKKKHVHIKPIGLQQVLIECITNEGDYVIDPAAGSYSVMDAAISINRKFLGVDLI